jgi:hypothetical protein
MGFFYVNKINKDRHLLPRLTLPRGVRTGCEPRVPDPGFGNTVMFKA